MPATKIQDLGEAKRWFEEGRTYDWMVQEYARKYNIETGISMWSNLRRRQGWERRANRDEALLPWHLKPEHRNAMAPKMLRAEARRRVGMPLTEDVEMLLDNWIAKLQAADAVVHYEPDTDEGWFYVPRRPTDEDLIREPKRTRVIK